MTRSQKLVRDLKFVELINDIEPRAVRVIAHRGGDVAALLDMSSAAIADCPPNRQGRRRMAKELLWTARLFDRGERDAFYAARGHHV
jgi:hypothetical protein